jgi:hypothetical protein
MSGLIVLLLSVRAVRLDPERLYGVSLPLGAEAKLHRMCARKLPPITAPTRAGVRYGAPALRMAPVQHLWASPAEIGFLWVLSDLPSASS